MDLGRCIAARLRWWWSYHEIKTNKGGGWVQEYEAGDGVPIQTQERRAPTVGQAAAFIEAALTGRYISAEIARERQQTCAGCEFKRVNAEGTGWCGVCGCKVSAREREITNLAAYEENLPKWGCKHPGRAEGKGWNR